jgi:acyl carrier protein
MPSPPDSADRDAIASRVLEVVSGLVGELRGGRTPAAIGLTDSLERDLGVSSLERVELLLRLERDLGVRLPEIAVAEAGAPADLVEAAVRAAPAAAVVAPARTARAAEGAARPAPTAARSLVDVLRWHVPYLRHRGWNDGSFARRLAGHRKSHAAQRVGR